MRQITLASGESIPVLGQGTWGWGEDPGRRCDEIAALRSGLDLGMTLVDTAEMYGDGGAEEVVGEALAGRRDRAFVVSKVLPSHASRSGTIAACERSLGRLATDRIDLYLLHWPGHYPLEDTLAAFDQLVENGKIRYWGVSNFDHVALAELRDLPGSAGLATDQVLYNLSRRGPEYDLLPWCADNGLPVMAYSPIEQGRILHDATLGSVAARHGISAAATALTWVLRRDSLCTVPNASSPQHVCDNATALDTVLTPEDLDALDCAFPPPSGPRPLEILYSFLGVRAGPRQAREPHGGRTLRREFRPSRIVTVPLVATPSHSNGAGRREGDTSPDEIHRARSPSHRPRSGGCLRSS